MKSKTITISLLCFVIFIFTIYFITEKNILSEEKNVDMQLNNVIEFVNQGKWAEANLLTNTLMKTWGSNKYYIYLNYAEADYSFFIDNIARLQGAIKTRNETDAISLALSTKALWNNFLKVIPEP